MTVRWRIFGHYAVWVSSSKPDFFTACAFSRAIMTGSRALLHMPTSSHRGGSFNTRSRGKLASTVISGYSASMGRERQFPPTPDSVGPGGGSFPSTHWTELNAAGRRNSTAAGRAIDGFCRAYWRPVYNYIRRQGCQQADAQDLTQAFFARFLEKRYLDRLEHRDGRFRSFLLTFLKRFLADERNRATAQKRGGGIALVPLEDFRVEEGLLATDSVSAERAFDRSWAMTLLERAQLRLQAEYGAANKGRLYAVLNPYLTDVDVVRSYAEAAAELGIPENSVKSAVHRLRRRYGQLIREEVSCTVETPLQVDEEIRYLRLIVAGWTGCG